MEKFYRQDNMTIAFGPKPGKGPCLEFHSTHPVLRPELVGNQRQVLKDIATFITMNVQYRDATLHNRVQASRPFIQGQGDDWLLIEFWSKPEVARDVCLLLAGKFDFEFECEPMAEVQLTKAQSHTQAVYSYFSLREWKILHQAIKDTFLKNWRLLDNAPVSADEIQALRTKLPSESDV